MALGPLIVSVLIGQLLSTGVGHEELSFSSTSAFKYFYPLVLVNLTRTGQLEKYAAAGAVDGGVNVLSPSRTRPDSSFRQIVKANVDTLYITAWLDLSAEPLVLGVPSITDRFYMVQMMDAWSNSFASPGTRTTGTEAGHFAVCGPGFKGNIPDGVTRLNSTTNVVWLLARVQLLEGSDDLSKAHAIQDKFSLSMLSEWIKKGDAARRPAVTDHSTTGGSKPPEVVDSWNAQEYFTYAAEVLKKSSPPAADSDMLKTLEDLGIKSGSSLQWGDLSLYQRGQLSFGKTAGKAAIVLAEAKIRTIKDGWQGLPNTIGDYGTDYDTRAAVAGVGLGANKADDACYRVNNLKGGSSYKLRFAPGQLPPVQGFWSITAYDNDGYLVPNNISRYARGSESGLHAAADGSVTIYMQEKSPSDAEEAQNWLPIPSDGTNFVATARFYFPGKAILDGNWTMPAVTTGQRTIVI